jgi:hypothetical protein
MTIEIQRVPGGFLATVLEADGHTVLWQAASPLNETRLREALASRGFDQREVEEAFMRCDQGYFSVGRW